MSLNTLVQQLDTVDSISPPKNVQFTQNNQQMSIQPQQPPQPQINQQMHAPQLNQQLVQNTMIRPVQNNVPRPQSGPNQQQMQVVRQPQPNPPQQSGPVQNPPQQQVGFAGGTITILGTQISKKTIYFAIFLIAILAIFYFFNKNKKTSKKNKKNKSKKSNKDSEEENDDNDEDDDE